MGLVDVAAPDVDHRVAVEVDGDGGADVVAPVELVGEGAAHPVESWIAGAFDVGHGLVAPLVAAVVLATGNLAKNGGAPGRRTGLDRPVRASVP